jgi:hypothetical protein
MINQNWKPLVKYSACLLMLAFGLSSCATILNSRKERVDIIPTVPARAVVGLDTIEMVKNRIRLNVPRSEQALRVKLLAGKFANEYQIESKNSFAYWFNLYANYGIGMLIDQDNPKRYSYPSRIYLNPLNPNAQYRRWQPSTRNQEIAFRIFVPYLNIFQVRPDFEPDIKTSGGFWGLGVGLDFYHQPDQFISLSMAAQTNFFVPVPAAVDVVEEYEFIRSEEVTFTNNHWLGRFTMGYGISFSNNTWEFRSAAFGSQFPPSRRPSERSTATIGLAFPIHYYTGDHFYFRMVYRPSFWRFSRIRPFGYEHLVSLGFGWDI